MVEIAILLILIGIPFSMIGLRDVVDSLNYKAWGRTQGVINKSNITEIKSEATSSYIPDIRYAYTVEGNVYASNKVYLGIVENLSLTEANNCVHNLSPGTEITVFYKRNNPEKSVLTISGHKPSILKFWISILPICLGISMILSIPAVAFYSFMLWCIPVIWLVNDKKSPFSRIQKLDK